MTALTNGNYVVSSPYWDYPAGPVANVGAVTWCSGAGGCSGLVITANSLSGGMVGDQVGFGVKALTNGNYVVLSPAWDNPAGPIVDAGAVTWRNGTSGTTGLVTAANSLIGGTAGDQVGYSVAALTNGNYAVTSPIWDNPAGPVTNVGAVTWGNGSSATTGLVTSANSLVGSTMDDQVGAPGVVGFTNGSYLVLSPSWDNPAGPVVDAGAATWGSGTGGTTGPITAANSVLSMILYGISGYSYDATYNRLLVGRGPSNRVSILYTPTVMLPLVVR